MRSKQESGSSAPAPSTISIVLPCHNEVNAVGPVLNQLALRLGDWQRESLHLLEVIVVNDGSTDETTARVFDWKQRFATVTGLHIILISHAKRRGYGAALKTGIAAARGDLVVFYDVDGTYDPKEIPKMVSALISEEAEMVCGDRLSQVKHMPLTREIGNRLFVGTINLLYRTRVYDSCTGMRLFRKDLKSFFSSEALPDGLDYSLAMTLSFLRTGHKLAEVPIPYSRRIGRSKLSVFTDGPRFFGRIIGSWLHTSAHVREAADERLRRIEKLNVMTNKRPSAN